MKFSVLMSVYSGEKIEYLVRALQSLLDQALRADELVLVEDGPIDTKMEEVIEFFSGKLNIHSVRLPVNSGLAIALNEGLKHCSYELVARMDSDDISLPERFEKQVVFMQENFNVSVSSANIEEIDDSGKVESIRKLPLDNRSIIKFAKKRNPISHTCAIFRKSDVLAVGGYPNFRKSQDYALWSLMLQRGYKFMNMSDILLQMRAGSSMYKRRNISYLMHELSLLKYQKNIGFLSHREYLMNAFSRSFLRLSPGFIKEYIYKNMRG